MFSFSLQQQNDQHKWRHVQLNKQQASEDWKDTCHSRRKIHVRFIRNEVASRQRKQLKVVEDLYRWIDLQSFAEWNLRAWQQSSSAQSFKVEKLKVQQFSYATFSSASPKPKASHFWLVQRQTSFVQSTGVLVSAWPTQTAVAWRFMIRATSLSVKSSSKTLVRMKNVCSPTTWTSTRCLFVNISCKDFVKSSANVFTCTKRWLTIRNPARNFSKDIVLKLIRWWENV